MQRAAAPLLALALVATACSGGDDGSGAGDGAAVATATTTATATTATTATALFDTTPPTESVELPADLPDVPLPGGVLWEEANSRPGTASSLWELTGWDGGEPVAAGRAYVSALEAAGFREVEPVEADDSLYLTAVTDEWYVSAGFYPDPIRQVGTSVGVTVAPVAASSAT